MCAAVVCGITLLCQSCLKQRWAKLQKSEDLTSEIPDSRWDGDFYCCLNDEVPGKVYTLRGGWLQERLLFGFDYKYFHMHRSEAQSMDPQFRMMLECIAEMKHGWTTPNNDGRIACIMGQTSNEYLAASTLHESQTQTGRFTNTGTNTCMLGNRACFEFNFRGPSFTCDTACSSALYATILCCQQIEDGCWGGVAGGANACLLPMTTIGFCKAIPQGSSRKRTKAQFYATRKINVNCLQFFKHILTYSLFRLL